MNRYQSFLVTLLACLSSGVLATDTFSSDAELATYRATVNELGTGLKTELLNALNAGSPLTALTTCRDKAPVITAAVSEKHELEVGRTSLKLRNPQNAADEWEMKVLQSFEERKAQGEDPAQLEFYEVVEEKGKKQARYMKAIPIAPPCLICHGSEVAPEVRAKLQTLYPKDQAIGFKMGDLRGAFTLIKALPN